MKNTLDAKVDSNMAIIEYGSSTKKRAELTQNGGVSILELTSLNPDEYNDKSIILDIAPRPHLGISDIFKRVGNKTDPEHIMDAFSIMIDQHLGG